MNQLIDVKTASIPETWAFLAAATTTDVTGATGRAPESVPLLPELRDYDLAGCDSDGDCHAHLVDSSGVVYLVVQDLDTLLVAMKKARIYLVITTNYEGFREWSLNAGEVYETPTEACLRAAVQAVQAREV